MLRSNHLPLIPFLSFALCVFSFAPLAAADQVIQIGSILILSGEGSSWGTASRNGIDMAVEKINGQGGVLGKKLSVKYQDDQGDPKQAISAFRQLTDVENIKFIIGPTWSRSGLPLIDSATQKKVVMISPSLGMAKFNESSPFLFNTWPHDYIGSEKLAEYVLKKGHRTVALVGAEEPWVKEQTDAFKRRFESLGGRIAYLTEPNPGATDLSAEALKITKTPGIEAVVSTTDGALVGSLVAKSLKELHFKIPIYSVTIDQTAIEAAQGGFEGMEFVTFLTPSPEFKAEYETRFRTTIDIGADSAYDAVMMLAEAMRKAGTLDSGAVARELGRIKDYRGVSGVLVSDGKRGFTKAYAIKRVGPRGQIEERNG